MGEKVKKEKKAKKESSDVDMEPAADRKIVLAPIAKPLADDKLSKKVGTQIAEFMLICIQKSTLGIIGLHAMCMHYECPSILNV